MPVGPERVITLTTDFGLAGHYVAEMKGAILSITTAPRLVDISHDIPPHDVRGAAWVLGRSFDAFPHGSIHVGVVDPGVGTTRRPILAVTSHHFFVGPDNGIFTFAFDAAPPSRVVAIAEGRRVRGPFSATFHGRDIFAPVAAHLALGARPEEFGDPVDAPVRLDIPEPVEVPGGGLRVPVVHIDHFGNVILNLTRGRSEERFGPVAGAGLRARTDSADIDLMVTTYADGAGRGAVLLFNSSGYLEIGADRRRADHLLGLELGDSVIVTAAP